MTARIPRFAVLRASVAALAAIALVIVACTTPHPTPAPIAATPSVPPKAQTVPIAATDPSPGMSMPAVVRDTQPRLPAAAGGTDSSLRTQMNARINADNEALRELLRARQDSAAVLLARIDSGERILWNRGLRASDDAQRVATAGGRPPMRGSGGSAGGQPPDDVRFGSGGVRGSGTYAGPSLSGPIVAIARQTAARLFPEAFQPHEGRFDLVTMVFDSTGAVVKTGRGTRGRLPLDDRIADRELLRATLPGVSIDTFSEWGMANLTTAGQSRGSGVMLLYAFMK